MVLVLSERVQPLIEAKTCCLVEPFLLGHTTIVYMSEKLRFWHHCVDMQAWLNFAFRICYSGCFPASQLILLQNTFSNAIYCDSLVVEQYVLDYAGLILEGIRRKSFLELADFLLV